MTEEEKAALKSATKILENVEGMSEEDSNKQFIDPTQTEYSVGIDLEQALKNPKSNADVVLRDGDRLVIPEFTNTVKISGDVMYPNVVAYNQNMKVRDYITMAGGYGDTAKKRKAYVVYMNGTVAKARKASSSVVEPGCEIIVPVKIKNEDLLPTVMSFVSATSSSASLLTTLYALVRTLNR